jgi:hypothetical protein
LRTTLGSQGRPEAVPALRAIGAFCADFLRPAAYDYVDHQDVSPALVATASWATRAATAAAGKGGRSPHRRTEVL